MTKVQGAPETPDGMFVFSGNRYFRVPPRFLIADRVLTFPLSFHFVRNKNLILKYRPGHRPTALQIVNYVSKGLLYFACPENFYTAWLEYLKNENPHALQTYLEEVQSLAMTAADSMSLLKSATEPIANLNDEAIRIAEKALAREAVGNPALPLAEKKRILVKIGNRMAALLDAFNSPDPEKRKSAYLECRTMTDEIVDIAAQSLKNKTTYQDLLMLKDSDIEHSSSVSTISVIFAMMLGFVDNQSLADISLGGLMHDIGHCHVPLEVFKIPYVDFKDETLDAFAEHARKGPEVLSGIGEDVPEIIGKIISEHHERFSGSGFLKGLHGLEIDDRVQLVGLADQIDDLMGGRVTGAEMSPMAAFQWIKDRQLLERSEIYFSPDLFESLHQIVMRTKSDDQAVA